MDEFGGSDIGPEANGLDADVGANDLAPENAPSEFPEDQETEDVAFDYQAMYESNPAGFDFAQAGVNAAANNADYQNLLRWQPRNGADEFGEDIDGAGAYEGTASEYAAEVGTPDDFQEDFEAPEYDDGLEEPGQLDDLAEDDYESTLALETDESEPMLEEDSATDTLIEDESDSDATQINEWEEGETVDIGHDGVGLDGSSYDAGESSADAVEEAEAVGETPPSMSSDSSEWDELQDVPFAGADAESEDGEAADGFNEAAIDDEATTDIASQSVDDADLGESSYDAGEQAADAADWVNESTHESGGHDFGDYETKFEKETTNQPETIGEMPPSMPVDTAGWDELRDVPFAGEEAGSEYDGSVESLDADALDAETATDIPNQSIDDVGDWLSDVNPKFDPWDVDSPYSSNCGSCALAVENRLNGNSDAVATDSTLSIEEMEQQTGMEQVSMQPDEIEQYLISQGPGSHAIVGIDRSEGPGHWFNAYYDGERVYALDGQTGTTEGWPPDYGDVVNWDVSVKKGE